MRTRICLLLGTAAVVFAACENTPVTSVAEPTLRIHTAKLIETGKTSATYEMRRNTSEPFEVHPEGWTIYGYEYLGDDRSAMTGRATTTTTFTITCHKLDRGTFWVMLQHPLYGFSRFDLTIVCVDRITTPMNRDVNLAEYFAAEGLVPVAAGVAPGDLATQITIDAAMHISAAESTALLVSSDAGDIGVRCLRQGEGILTVTFQDGSNDYNLLCGTQHEQGSGS